MAENDESKAVKGYILDKIRSELGSRLRQPDKRLGVYVLSDYHEYAEVMFCLHYSKDHGEPGRYEDYWFGYTPSLVDEDGLDFGNADSMAFMMLACGSLGSGIPKRLYLIPFSSTDDIEPSISDVGYSELYVKVDEHDGSQLLKGVKDTAVKIDTCSIDVEDVPGFLFDLAIQGSVLPDAPTAVDFGEQAEPGGVYSCIHRIIRDTRESIRVKSRYLYKCQICGGTIDLPDGRRYAETHHIKPMGEPHNGPDHMDNIICVCPNHHAQLDYGAIRLDVSKFAIHIKHQISDKYIDYHNSEIYGKVVDALV